MIVHPAHRFYSYERACNTWTLQGGKGDPVNGHNVADMKWTLNMILQL